MFSFVFDSNRIDISHQDYDRVEKTEKERGNSNIETLMHTTSLIRVLLCHEKQTTVYAYTISELHLIFFNFVQKLYIIKLEWLTIYFLFFVRLFELGLLWLSSLRLCSL